MDNSLANDLFVVDSDSDHTVLFSRIAKDLQEKGYSLQPAALPVSLCQALFAHQCSMQESQFSAAGVGRKQHFQHNGFVRTDAICWIDGSVPATSQWLRWCDDLKLYLNSRLFLGLFSFESHFAHYAPGSFYKKHYDAFKGDSNRTLSIVTYMNPNWQQSDGGELVIYQDEHDREGLSVLPALGTVAIFLSEDFLHEVKAAKRDRYSIAGWFRVNTSHGNKIDPPH